MILTIQKVSLMRETCRSGQAAAKAAFSYAGGMPGIAVFALLI